MPTFVSRRGLEQRSVARDQRQLQASKIISEIGYDGTALFKDESNSYLASQMIGALAANGGGIVYGREILIEDTEEYLGFDGVTVIRGSTVVLQYEDGQKYSYTILGSNEGGAGNGTISCDCDFALEMLGRKKDQTFTFRGEKIKILSVERI